MRLSYVLTTLALAIGPALAAPLSITPESLITRSLPTTGTNGAIMINKRTIDAEAEVFERRDWSSLFKVAQKAVQKVAPKVISKVGSKGASKAATKAASSVAQKGGKGIFSKLASALGSSAKKMASGSKVKNITKNVAKGATKNTSKGGGFMTGFKGILPKNASKNGGFLSGFKGIISKVKGQGTNAVKNAWKKPENRKIVKDVANDQAQQFLDRQFAAQGAELPTR